MAAADSELSAAAAVLAAKPTSAEVHPRIVDHAADALILTARAYLIEQEHKQNINRKLP